jgi:cell division topological specificity factor
MKDRRERTGIIAKERLKLMLESEPIECGQDKMEQMKKEISEIISRYLDDPPDGYEIKILRKQNKKRA